MSGIHHQSMTNLQNAGNHQANYLCSQSSSHMMADKSAQFNNQMDTCSGAATSGVCTKPPDVYLSMLTIHKVINLY